MAYPTLASSTALTGFPGAPFDPSAVESACESVRGDAGWHIAPEVTETLTVVSYGGVLLTLPTRRIVAVAAVRDMTTTATLLTGWRRMGCDLYSTSGWPVGTLEVDLTHGFPAVPPELLPVIAQRVSAGEVGSNVRQRSTTRGPFGLSETYRDTATLDPAVLRYAVLSGVA